MGSLSTIRKSDLGMENITPKERYYMLNDALTRVRGEEHELKIKGADELHVKHDSVMMESCNTSFQIHFQVSQEDFARLYNIAQLVAAPVLGAAANSPFLFGKQLLHETRIAVFQQSIDNRKAQDFVNERKPRVQFGSRWIEESVMEIFQEDIARFRVLFAIDDIEDPLKRLTADAFPNLRRSSSSTARFTAGTGPVTASPTANLTSESKTGCCHRGPLLLTKWPMRRSGSDLWQAYRHNMTTSQN